jgi:hypothetical protein
MAKKKVRWAPEINVVPIPARKKQKVPLPIEPLPVKKDGLKLMTSGCLLSYLFQKW